MATLLSLAALAFGLVSYNQLPVSDLPNVDFPTIAISATYPGASPETVATTITTPLERQLIQIAGLQQITSTSSESRSSITLSFLPSRSIDSIVIDVQAAMSRAQADLPPNLPSQPTYKKLNTEAAPVMYLAAYSDTLTAAELYDFANGSAAQQLSSIEGVAQVSVYGTKRAIRTQVNPLKLHALGLSLADVALAMETGSSMLPTGNMQTPEANYFLKTEAQLNSAKEFGNLIVAAPDGSPIRLNQIGRVIDGVSSPDFTMDLISQGKLVTGASVVVAIYKSPGMNTVALADSIKTELSGIKKLLPNGISMEVFYDGSLSIIDSITDVKDTLFIAFVLVVVVVFIFLGRLRDTLIPAVAIPFSLLMTFIVMNLLGYNLDNLSLMALTLAVGFVVDDAIVILENAVRRMQDLKEDAKTAALNSSREIGFTIFSITISLAAVFLPLMFLPGIIGLLFKEFAVTIIVTIVMSGIVSLTLSPMMCARFLKKHSDRQSWLVSSINAVFGIALRVNGKILHWMLAHKPLALLVWVACLVGSVVLMGKIPKGLLPEGDSGAVMGSVVAMPGASAQEIKKAVGEIAAAIDKNKYVNFALVNGGYSGSASGTVGTIFCGLVPRKDRPPIEEVVSELRDSLEPIMVATGIIKALPMLGFGGDDGPGAISYTLRSTDPKQLYKYARKLEEALHSVAGLRDIQSTVSEGAPAIVFKIKRDHASVLGVDATTLERTLGFAFSGGRVTTVKTSHDQYDVILELLDKFRNHEQNLMLLTVPNASGDLIPLSEVASWRIVSESPGIKHESNQTAVQISFNLKKGVKHTTAVAEVKKVADTIVPNSIAHGFGGAEKQTQDTSSSMLLLLLLSVGVMYIVLGILYESYLHPITVLSSLPVAAYGGLFTLYAFGAELSIYAFIGLFLLLGIVKKNGIMVVDFAIKYRAEGMGLNEAIVQSCQTRFRPILMTTMAAMMGALPIAMGFGADGGARQPLGLVIVGGLAFAQIITLYVTPILYVYMDRLEQKFHRTGAEEGREVDAQAS